MQVKLSSILAFVILLGLAANVYAQSSVSIEFFYYVPCATCPGSGIGEYIEASNLVDKIERDYGSQVQVERVDRTTAEGRERYVEYGLTGAQVVVVNQKIILQDDQIIEEDLRRYIDAYLRGDDPASNTFQPVTAFFAFSTGLLSGLSPCLMAMLGFILSYTSGTASGFKSGMFRVLIFGIGFISALLLIGALFAAVLISIPSFATTMTWMAAVFIIAVGLNLVGLLPLPSSLRSLGQKLGSRGRVELAQRYRATTVGLFSLGFLFYFVSICTAPLSFTVLPTLSAPNNIYLLPLFGIGALLPFLLVGIVAGGSPALAKRIGQQHRFKIRALSGAILLVYSVWLIGFNLLATEMASAYPHVVEFSQSLLAMFAFILVYSASVSKGWKDSLSRTVTFALGIIIGAALATMSLELAGITFYLTLFAQLSLIIVIVAAIMIFAGLSLTGILTRFVGSQSLLQRLAARRNIILLSLLLLGFLAFFATFRTFPFTDFIITEAQIDTYLISIDTYLLLAFSLMLLIPFLAIGIIAGATPKLAGKLYEKHQPQIHAFGGMILIAYALWLLLNQFV
jgi:cytochrome c biogenesis protein CcdA